MGAHHPADTNNDGVVTPEEKAAWQAANPGANYGSSWQGLGSGNNFKTPFGNVRALTTQPGADQKRADLNATGNAAGNFAGVGEQGYNAMSGEAAQARAQLAQLASGQNSLSAEQLRQGLQQNMNAQRSMIASASPQNGPMAALMGAQNMGRMGAGMSGQAAIAGIQERQGAQQALAQMIMQQRQQDAQVALGSRGNAINAFGGVTPGKSKLEQYAPIINGVTGGLSVFAKSDRRAKEDIEDGDGKARTALKGLKAFTYKYKDQRDGKGEQFGPMAQDLEKAGLKHAVIDTPNGKMVHGAKAALSSLGLVAALGKRVEQLEKKGK